jgi:hypothetical protein
MTVEPRPMDIGGYRPIEKSFNLEKYGIHYQISTDSKIGFFPKSDKDCQRLKKIDNSKILSLGHAPKSCRQCGGFMTLRRNGEGYTCRNAPCLDRRSMKKVYRRDILRRQLGKKPIMPRISMQQLEQILKA